MGCANWHVAVLRWGRWQDAYDALTHVESVVEVCVPTRIEMVTLRGRSVERRVPWLGPLALARWPTADPHSWHDVARLPSIAGIVGGWPPAIVPREQVTRLLRSIDAAENKEPVKEPPPCQPGDFVRFTHLAFFNLVGYCRWVSEADVQVGLQLTLLGHDVVLPVPYAAVEQVTTPSRASVPPQFGRRRRRRRLGRIVTDA